MKVQGDLVVAAPARVQLECHISHQLPQPPLDGCMHVLVGERPRELSGLYLIQHRFETPYQIRSFFLRDDPLLSEHPGVGDGAPDVVWREPDVEGDRGVEKFESLRGGRRAEPAAPERPLFALLFAFVHGGKFSGDRSKKSAMNVGGTRNHSPRVVLQRKRLCIRLRASNELHLFVDELGTLAKSGVMHLYLGGYTWIRITSKSHERLPAT